VAETWAAWAEQSSTAEWSMADLLLLVAWLTVASVDSLMADSLVQLLVLDLAVAVLLVESWAADAVETVH
jgi:hypothetical protein